MAPILYMSPLSPPSRAVLITAHALGIDLELKVLDLSKGEHYKPQYLKLNPLHSVPTLVDEDGTTITESHAINAYLVRKYSLNDALYPRNYAKRALVDQRLHFDTGVLFHHFRKIAGLLFYGKSKLVLQEDTARVLEAYKFLELFLENCEWIAGSEVTIADFSIATTVTSLNLLVPLNESKFPKTVQWIRRFESLSYAKVNEFGLADLKDTIERCMT